MIDYTQADFTSGGRRYDVILDCAAWGSMSAKRRALSPEGRHVVVGGSLLRIAGSLPQGLLWRVLGSRKRTLVLAHEPNKDLARLKELLEARTLVPLIDGRHALADASAAFRRFGEGRVCGKAVLTV